MAKFRFSFSEGIYCLAVVLVQGLLGFSVAKVHPGATRRLITALLGLLSAFALCGSSSIHLIIFSVVTSLVLHGCQEPSKGGTATLLLTFGYLIFFRAWHDCAQTHGILMQMALRVISLAVDFRDKGRVPSVPAPAEGVLQQSVPDSVLKTLGYFWCYVGLLSTPAIRYRTYEHFISGRYQVLENRRKELFIELMKIIVGVIPIAMILHFMVSTDHASSHGFLEQPLWFKLLYIAAMSFGFRCRLQVGIMMGEASAVAVGLGIYPGNVDCAPETGPIAISEQSQSDVNTMTVYSVRPSVELEVTLREFVVKWNRTVQSWLVRCFYKQFTGPKQFRLLCVFLFSGFWHGNDISHWLFFLQVGVYILLGEAGFSKKSGAIPFWAKWFVHNLAFGYWHIPYLVLDLSKTWEIYSSLYFCGHVLLFISALLTWSKRGTSKRSA